MLNSSVSFLLVEDDELDVETFCRAIRKQKLEVGLRLAGDGVEALRVLRDKQHAKANSETIVVLDLNMPGMNGHEFLEELRMDEGLRGTTVFVLTSSEHERDIRAAYNRNVAGYFVKSEIGSFIETVSRYVASARFPSCCD